MPKPANEDAACNIREQHGPILPSKKTVSRGNLCQAINCSNLQGDKKPGIRFHRFPEDIQLARIWVNCLRNKSLDKLPIEDIIKSRRVVCSDHFEDKMYANPTLRHNATTRLCKDAEPRLINCPNAPKISSTRRFNRLQINREDPVNIDEDTEPMSKFFDASPNTYGSGQLLNELKNEVARLRYCG